MSENVSSAAVVIGALRVNNSVKLASCDVVLFSLHDNTADLLLLFFLTAK